MADKKEYTWRLTWCGRKPTTKLLYAASYCKTFPLWRDSEAHLVNYTEYMALVNAGEIAKPESYWQVEPGQLGMVSLTYYRQYRKTWDAISLCKCDYEDGWDECEKRLLDRINECEKPVALFK